jgi:phosphate uptake regulator
MTTRRTLELEIQELEDEIIILGSMVEQSMLDSVDALKKRDVDWFQKGTNLLHRSLAAFVNEDAEAARLISQEDDEVDQLYLQVYRELMTYIISDPRVIERAKYLLWAAHNLERFVDRVTNICERTLFVVTGENRETSGGQA